MTPRRRADRLLVERGLFESRARARAAIEAGLVVANHKPVTKPSETVPSDAVLQAEPAHPYAVEMECIDALRPGEVLVATTNGDHGSALWGELLSTASRAPGNSGSRWISAARRAKKASR